MVVHPDLLEHIEIARPCPASWDRMIGDERVRFCRECRKNVYNFSAMTRGEALQLLAVHEGNLCVRLYRRPDGTLVTANCRRLLLPLRWLIGLLIILPVSAAVFLGMLIPLSWPEPTFLLSPSPTLMARQLRQMRWLRPLVDWLDPPTGKTFMGEPLPRIPFPVAQQPGQQDGTPSAKAGRR